MAARFKCGHTTLGLTVPSTFGYFVLTAVFNTSSSSLSLNGTSATGLSIGNSSLTNGIRIGCNHIASNDYLDGAIAEFHLRWNCKFRYAKYLEGYLLISGVIEKLAEDHPYKFDFQLNRKHSSHLLNREVVVLVEPSYIWKKYK